MNSWMKIVFYFFWALKVKLSSWSQNYNSFFKNNKLGIPIMFSKMKT